MKQVAQNYRSGELAVLDVPVPACKPGGVLVRSLFSLISTGTETMKVSEARLSLVGKARARPDQVRKVVDSVRQQGAKAAYLKAMTKLDSLTPLGYSLSGVVVEVGPGAEEFAVGDVVAAAGNEFALHAEVNWVPKNLCVPVPDGVAAEHAAFATVGAIAMQGVRRAEPQLGETACVIGLGLVGQLVVRLLLAAGVRVVGLDTVEARCRMAEKAGALVCGDPGEPGLAAVETALLAATGGLGADHVLLAAGGESNGPVEMAARLARDRARIVDIGKTSLDLPWNAYYEKELDVRFSRSYGPGRYDDRYELDGIDYPAGYVRWSERRNLACFLDLLATGTVDISPLVSAVHPVDDAPSVYDAAASRGRPGVGHLFEYPDSEMVVTTSPRRLSASTTPGIAATRVPAAAPPARATRYGLGFVGAGVYAIVGAAPPSGKGSRDTSDERRHDHVAVRGQRPAAVRLQSVTTDADAVLDDPSVDAVFVVTRHHSHARFVCAALERGKAVFVEKPLALSEQELEMVVDGDEDGQPAAHGRLQPQVRATGDRHAPTVRSSEQSGAHALPGQRRTPRRRQLVRGRGDRGFAVHRRGRSLHRPHERMGGSSSGPGARRAAAGRVRRPAADAELRRRVPRHPHLHDRRSASSPQGDVRLLRRWPLRAVGQLHPGDGLAQRRQQGRQACVRWRRQGPGRRPGRLPCRRTDRGADADPARVCAEHHARDPGGADQPATSRTGVTVTRPVAWYARRLRQMSVPEVSARSADTVRRAVWSSRRVAVGEPAGMPTGLKSSRRFSTPLPPEARHQVPAEAADRLVAAADRLLAGSWTVLGSTASRHRHAGLVPRPGDRSPCTARPARLPCRPPWTRR